MNEMDMKIYSDLAAEPLTDENDSYLVRLATLLRVSVDDTGVNPDAIGIELNVHHLESMVENLAQAGYVHRADMSFGVGKIYTPTKRVEQKLRGV
jgi:hypothetical protein